MIEPYGLVVILLGLIMAAYTFKEFYRKRIGTIPFIIWIIIWIALISTGVYPQLYLGLASSLGMAAPIQFVTTFSIIILFAIVYQIFRTVGDINRKITKIVQHVALEKPEDEIDQ